LKDDRPVADGAPISGASPAEAAGHAAYRVTLPEFEGPLDLLLHLCQTHELDILNISIAFVAEKYIEYLELMENMSVEVAADYLVMAAHLAYLKSRELVPSPEPLEPSEDGEAPVDPREELIRRLLEYQKYKHAAENLGGRPIEGRNVFVRGAVLESEGEAGLAEHSVWKLLEHWARVLEKTKPVHTHDVIIDRISISDRINQLVDLLESGDGMIHFEDLLGQDLAPAELRHKVVVSLLAVLELARLRVVRILQQESTGAFFLAKVEGAGLADARNLNITSAKEAEREEGGETQRQETQLPPPKAASKVVAEGDKPRISPQEDIISAPSRFSAEEKSEKVRETVNEKVGENPSDGKTKAEQKTPPE
jgi:segregation and condensation protein A